LSSPGDVKHRALKKSEGIFFTSLDVIIFYMIVQPETKCVDQPILDIWNAIG
jgi:hypothetical protein